MVVEVGKDPAPLVNTAEETSTLLVASLSGEIPFLIGSDPRRTIAFASISNGRITRRFPFDKGAINSLAFAPDAKTFYCAAGGSIWSIPLAGGSPTQIRSGDSFAMDPAGQYLLIQVNETPKARLLRVLLNGGTEQETPLNGLFHMTFDPIHSESIAPHLSSERISNYLMGEVTIEETAHAHGCAMCQGELARLESSLSLFRRTVRRWSGAVVQLRIANPDDHLARLLPPASLDAPWYRSLVQSIQESIRPPKLPPLEVTSKPVAVKDIWGLYGRQKKSWAYSTSFQVVCSGVAVHSHIEQDHPKRGEGRRAHLRPGHLGIQAQPTDDAGRPWRRASLPATGEQR
jgi:hypothetical protein